MPLVTLTDIHVSFATKVIFDKLELKVYPGEKVGLIGPNGCGKTTILKLIFGLLEPDMGHVKQRKDLKVGYLPQEPVFSGDKTVLEELHAGAEAIFKAQRKLQELAETFGQLGEDELKAAMGQYDRLGSEFELCGGYKYEMRVKAIAAGLGLDEKYYKLKTSQLSGGQLSRVGLAKVLLADAGLLLLDEPTNHLDWEATLWLERFLKNYKGSALIVSHDRFLLDRLVCKIVEVNEGRAKVHRGNYSSYKQEKEKRDLQLERQYQQRTEFIERTRDFIARNKDREGMRKVARGRKKYINRILHYNPDFLEKPKQNKELNFKFAEVKKKGERAGVIVECKNLAKRFDGLTLFEDLNFELLAGQRLGIVGPNGTGKTTFLKLILGQTEPSSGNIKVNNNLSIGYLDQAGVEVNGENSVLAEAGLAAGDQTSEKLRGRLGAFLFTGDAVFKKVCDLSGGERNRFALCKLVLSQPEVLILDEPTNHLDIPSTEALENALKDYNGTMIVVSHDRFFLEKIADQLLVIGADELGKKSLAKFEFINGSFGRYAELLEERAEAANNKEKSSALAKPKRARQNKPGKVTPPELRQFNAWSVEKIEDAINKAELEIAAMHGCFGDEKIYKDYTQLAKLQEEFDDKKQYLDLLYQAYELKSKK